MDLTKSTHDNGKKYLCLEGIYKGQKIKFIEDSHLVKNWNNGSYYYEPSGFFYLYTLNDQDCWCRIGNISHDYGCISGKDFSGLAKLADRLLAQI